MSKLGGPGDVWNSTTLKTQCKNPNESIFESGIPLQKTFKVDKVQCIIHQVYRQNDYISFISIPVYKHGEFCQ